MLEEQQKLKERNKEKSDFFKFRSNFMSISSPRIRKVADFNLTEELTTNNIHTIAFSDVEVYSQPIIFSTRKTGRGYVTRNWTHTSST